MAIHFHLLILFRRLNETSNSGVFISVSLETRQQIALQRRLLSQIEKLKICKHINSEWQNPASKLCEIQSNINRFPIDAISRRDEIIIHRLRIRHTCSIHVHQPACHNRENSFISSRNANIMKR